MNRKSLTVFISILFTLLFMLNINVVAQPDEDTQEQSEQQDLKCELEVNPSVLSVLWEQSVKFEVTVKNTGEANLENVVVSEGENNISQIQLIKPGESKTVQYNKQVTPGAEYTFTAAFDGGSVKSPITVKVNQSTPAVEIVREIMDQNGNILPDNSDISVMSGQNIQIKYTISNIGDTDLPNLEIRDQGVNFSWDKEILKIGQSDSRTININVNKKLTSNPKVIFGGDILDEVTSVAISPQKPGLEIQVSPLEVNASKGEDVQFEVIVNNTGTTAIDNIVIQEKNSGKTVQAGSIMSGGHVKKIITMTVEDSTQYIFNAKGVDKFSGQELQTSEKTVNVTVIQPKLKVTLKVDPTYIQSGEQVTYTYMVINAGNADISDIVLIDSIFGEIARISSLKPGEQRSFTKDITLEGSTQNDAFAEGKDAAGNRVSAVSELVSVEVEAAAQDEGKMQDELEPDLDLEDVEEETTVEQQEEEIKTGTDFLLTFDNILLIVAVIAFLGSGIGLIYMIATGIRRPKAKPRR